MPTVQLEKRKSLTLRKHQVEAEKIADEMRNGTAKTALFYVTPGGGKSLIPITMFRKLPPGTKIAWFVPRDSLRRQAAMDALEHGVTLLDCKNQLNPSNGTDGFVTTHASLTANPDLWEAEFRRHPYLLVIDELHHASTDDSGEDGRLAAALSRLQYRYLVGMTGTLERNNTSERIWSLVYTDNGHGLMPDGNASYDRYVRYSRADALDERAIVRSIFRHCDGQIKYLTADGKEVTWENLSQVSRESQSAALQTALATGYAHQLFEACYSDWKACRVPNSKLIVICSTQSECREYHRALFQRGDQSFLAISDNKDSADAVRGFRQSGRGIMVTCQMGYEGLNVPTITHEAFLTLIRSTPWLEQAFARASRVSQGKGHATIFVPDDPKMNEAIAAIKAEESKALRQWKEREGGGGGGGDVDGDIMPLEGSLVEIRRSALDGSDITDAQLEFARVVADAGHDINQPPFRDAYSALGVPAIKPHDETPGEKKARRSKDLADFGRALDAKHCKRPSGEVDWGHHASLVCKKFRVKGSDDLSCEQLEEAYVYLSGIRAR